MRENCRYFTMLLTKGDASIAMTSGMKSALITRASWLDYLSFWLIPRSPSGRLRELLIARMEPRLSNQEFIAACAVANVRFLLHVRGSDAVGRNLLLTGFVEYYTSRLISNLLRPNTTFLDIGANVGYFTVLAALRQPSCRIVAIEPVPETFDRLDRNIALNRIQNVITVPQAVGDYIGTTVVRLGEDSGFSSIEVSSDEDSDQSIGNDRLLKVTITTVDDICERHDLKQIDLVKVDVEGYEEFVFRGMRRVISRNHPIIVTEMEDHWHRRYQSRKDRIVDQFREDEYLAFALSRYGLLEVDSFIRYPGIENYVFVPRKRRQEFLRAANRSYGWWGLTKSKLRRSAYPVWQRLRKR